MPETACFQRLRNGAAWTRRRSYPVFRFAREESDRQQPFGRALDVGCGSGIWAVKLAQRGWDVTGIDFVPKAVRRARRRLLPRGASRSDIEAAFPEWQVVDEETADMTGAPGFVEKASRASIGSPADHAEKHERQLARVPLWALLG